MKENKESYPNVRLSGKLPRQKGEHDTNAQKYHRLNKNDAKDSD